MGWTITVVTWHYGSSSVASMTPPERPLPTLDGVTHRFVDLPGLRMHVAEAGHGAPVLLLHGFPQHWWEWRKVIPTLAVSHRVICPDLRGAGWTEAPRKGYTRAQLVADVVALLDALELDRVDLLTHDYGSLVGYQLGLEHPERVGRHLALSIPPPYFGFDMRLPLAMARHARFELVLPVPGLGPRWIRGKHTIERAMFAAHTSHEAALTREDKDLFLGPLREPERARAGSALYRHFIIPEAVRIMAGNYRRRRLSTPTHVLLGRDDPIVSAELVHGVDEYVDDWELEVVDGASHFIADDRPDVVADRALHLFGRPLEDARRTAQADA
jgi:pimeloyl-ACP methyl ester carboxylesterase